MKLRLTAVIPAVALCLFLVSASRPVAQEAPRPVVGRSMVVTEYGIVAASQPLAARAGVQVLERGGNAIRLHGRRADRAGQGALLLEPRATDHRQGRDDQHSGAARVQSRRGRAGPALELLPPR
ncbi:MAG TPA: hypothetical protein DCP38_11180 [Acidobacteria bacterium]|nr:hypothetical protein [Acidobacteriota bacterium]HAK56026.1 hypothetical protein [Acidobacteriota bacterium]